MKRNLIFAATAAAMMLVASCTRGKETVENNSTGDTLSVQQSVFDQESTSPAQTDELIAENASQNQVQENSGENEAQDDNADFKPKMVLVDGGTFQLGSDRLGFHEVTVSSFEIGQTEVTQEQYFTVSGETEFDKKWSNYPETGINWYEAVIFCNRLSMKYGYEPCYTLNGETDPSLWGDEIPYFTESDGSVGDMTAWNAIQCNFNANGYRLPTEAEWVFSAQGGNKSLHTKYSGGNNINEVGWTRENAAKDTHEVASKKPNELGIYDMSGNVWEWCWDRNGTHASEPEYNPTGPTEGSWYRVIRGGGWGTPASSSEVTYHSSDEPDVKSWYYGFRLCRSIGERTAALGEKSSEKDFVHCFFDSAKDQIILSNESGDYKLSVWVYGTPIEYGEYQIFGSDKETLLEGFLQENNSSRDLKTTLFVNYSEDAIKVSGSAQLYKPNSASKSGEILDFSYEGTLVKLQE